jgi:hypothetical protein
VTQFLTDLEDLVNLIHRGAATALVSGVAVASLAAPSAAAGHAASAHHKTSTISSPAQAAAGYLARQLAGKHHDHYVDIVGKAKYADDGETADAILSMDAAGVSQAAARRATRWLEKDAKNYLGGSAPNVYPGSAAKLLLVADAQHVNPRKFNGINLISALLGTEGSAGAAPGQFQNPADTQFSSSVIVQSLAILALADTATVDAPDEAAVNFLASQSCPDGGFQVSIRSSGGCSNEDVDATAYAIQALIAGNAKAKVTSAVRWLRTKKNADGGWSEEPGSGSRSDANSTAIAVEALIAAHGRAARGLNWLLKHQEGCSARASRRGAVRFRSGKFDPTTALRATTQAAAALARRPLAWIDRTSARSAAPVLVCKAAHRR